MLTLDDLNALIPALDNEIEIWGGADCGDETAINDAWVDRLEAIRTQLISARDAVPADSETALRKFTIPLMLTLDAADYGEAFELAEGIAEGLGFDGENAHAAHPDGHDNEGQRLFYLPAVG